MAKTIKTGLIITGDAKGGVQALKLTDEQLKGLNKTQKKAASTSKSAGLSYADAAKKVTAYGAAAGIAAAVGIGAMVAKQLQAIDTNTKIADKLGIATEKLTAMHIQAELSGVGISTLNEGLQRMVRRVGEAAQGTGEAKNALKELNINAVELAKLSPDKQFAAIGDAMAGVGNQADRVRLAFKLFDSGGVALLNTLKGGSAAALEAAAFTEQWGLAINRVDSAKIEQANDAMTKVSQASEGLWKQLTVKVAPALTGIAGEILGVSNEMGSASSMADKLFDGMVTGISFAADAARGLQVVWKGVTVLVAQGLSGILSAVAAVDRSVTALLNKMPEFLGGGTFTESSFLQNVAAAVKSTADGLTKELNTLATKALPSASIKKWLKETEKEVQKTAEKIAAESNVSTGLMNDNINSLPETLETSTAKMVATVQKNAPKAASVYVAAWDKAVERVDETFANAWTGAFDGFKSFSDNIVDSFKKMLAEMAHLAITKPILIGLGFGGSGSALAGGGSALGGLGGGGTSITSLISNAKSLLNINGAINGAIDGVVSGLFEAGFQDAAVNLGNYAQTITSGSGGIGGAAGGIGLNLAAGFAGSYAGNQIGSSLFGKTANSNIGATVGGIAGSYFGPLGTFAGAGIGGLLDSAFGGDGKKRAALGVRTGANNGASPGGIQLQGASGLQFSAYTKRAGSTGVEAANELTQRFLEIDTILTSSVRNLGGTVDLAGKSLVGKAHQAGKSGGDFFGSAVFNKIDGSAVSTAADEFVSAWLDAVESTLPARTRGILKSVSQDTKTIVGTMQSLGNIYAAMTVTGRDLFAVIDELERLASTSLYDSYVEQTSAAQNLASAYDGSLASLTAFESAMLSQRDTAFLVATQIRQAQASVADLFTSARKTIGESLLSKEDLYLSRRSEISELISQLGSASDPTKINSLSGDISRLSTTAFNSLDQAQRAQAGDEFLSFLTGAQNIAADRLATTAREVENGINQIDDIFIASADRLIESANVQQQAAVTFANGVVQFGSHIENMNAYLASLGIYLGEINI